MRTVSGSGVLLDLPPQLVEVEQPLGDQERRDDLLERRALLLGQVERDARTKPVDEPVRDLRRNDLVAQAVGADGLGMRLAHRLRKRFEQLRLHNRVLGELKLLSRVLQHELRNRQDDRELRPSKAAVLLRRAQQLLAGLQALRPCGRAARRLRAARSSGHGPAAPARRPPRRSTAPASAGDCPRARFRRPRRSSSRAALLRLSNVSRPSRISRLSGILMLTSLSEQSTPALLSMKSVLMRPPCSANSMRAGLGDAEVGALADHLCAELARHRRAAHRWPDRRRRPGSVSRP